ncbi:hypothetical protein GOBAR_AA26311 [Gossypium barbadense]|uniref:Uncharacterized protein n=1 Tax=Gossypium barbadense TaxID=3634 RepID=A0A2P5WTE1_GOSBA|nr:hypothetical protein GOBAR_AA26311 [Gossypium barbadense]
MRKVTAQFPTSSGPMAHHLAVASLETSFHYWQCEKNKPCLPFPVREKLDRINSRGSPTLVDNEAQNSVASIHEDREAPIFPFIRHPYTF